MVGKQEERWNRVHWTNVYVTYLVFTLGLETTSEGCLAPEIMRLFKDKEKGLWACSEHIHELDES